MVDVLSDVLSAVRIRGALFFDLHGVAPWALEAPASSRIAADVLPGSDHVMEFHVVLRGSCWASVVGGPAARLGDGDVVLFPQGDAHVLSSAPLARADVDEGVYRIPDGTPLPLRVDVNVPKERETADVQVVCGFFGCDARPFNPVLGALPRMVTIRAADGPSGSLLELVVRGAAAEANARRPGSEVMVNKLTEVAFVEVLRRYVASGDAPGTGWLAGLRDPAIARALGRIHAAPAEPWTIERLARAAGMSRSGFAQRFTEIVGLPPMQYVTRWRMQLASERLADHHVSLADVGCAVGYASEAAFLRAFKKAVGTSPGVWRRDRVTRVASARPGARDTESDE